MKLVKFTKKLSVEWVNETYGLTTEEWYKGTGLYMIEIGSRGEPGWLEYHGNVNEFQLKEAVDFINELNPADFEDEDDLENQKEYLEEYAGVDDSSVDETGIVGVSDTEEEGQDWFLVE